MELSCPTSWRELTQEQLRYVLFLLATFADPVVVKTYMFIRFAGIYLIEKNRWGWKCSKDGRVFYLQPWQIHSFLGQLEFVDSLETMDNRLEVVQGLKAVNALLQEDADTGRIVNFHEYLCMEQRYQRFLMKRDEDQIDILGSFLYRRADGSRPAELTLTAAERVGVLAWFGHIKYVMSHAFPNLFRKSKGDDDISDLSVIESINIQLRALTDGDVSKEAAVKAVDCWRALTELDARAKQAEEFRRKYPNT